MNEKTNSDFQNFDNTEKNKDNLNSQIDKPLDENLVPDYMLDTYNWAYVSEKNVNFLDNPVTVFVLLFAQDKKLLNSFLKEVSAGDRLLFNAHVYGHIFKKVAAKVGKDGEFNLSDITPIQVRHAYNKLKSMDWVNVWQEDATTTGTGEYDVFGSFFLLHEVPDDKKVEILNNMLNKTKVGGKSVFIDYANPSKFTPIRYILKVVNKYLEPFACALWENSIQHYADKELADNFEWKTETYFFGVYQKVVATRIK